MTPTKRLSDQSEMCAAAPALSAVEVKAKLQQSACTG